MNRPPRPVDEVLAALQERAKELACLYRVDEILQRSETSGEEVFQQVVAAIPAGWQYPEITRPVLTIRGQTYRPDDFQETPWVQRAEIRMRGEEIGALSVYYAEPRPTSDEGPFLKEERQLLNTLADRIVSYLLQRELAGGSAVWNTLNVPEAGEAGREWRVVIEFLEHMDPRLLAWITRKMLNHLCWKGIAEIAARTAGYAGDLEPETPADENRPLPRAFGDTPLSTAEVFRIASEHCTEEEILRSIQMWISQDRVSFLITTLEDQGSSLTEITEALERFQLLGVHEAELPHSVQTMLRVALLRRYFTDQIHFINTAKSLVSLQDFHRLSRRVLRPPHSHGKLGGKTAGLLLAQRIVELSPDRAGILRDIRVPRSWYITSDAVLAFVRYNNLEDVYDRKYLELELVRQQYPHVVHVFKNSPFPPELAKGLSAALDDLGDKPLIVRSSSLLEDRTGAAFSGKYKSLFLANQGSKQERLQALQDAVAEVYASIFGPDPIEYRAERNLLDVHEEMGIMIQQVVGTRVGRYFLPVFSGVAFSNNEFRWSPRIERADGLVRLVLGLGTRAVDRLSDDYPVLLAPGQPGLRVSTTPEEVVRYSPKMVDLIDLEANRFETIPIRELLREWGPDLPMVRRMVSLVEPDHIRRPTGLMPDFHTQDAVVTFDGLAAETPFMSQMATLLGVLRERLGTPVDIEFACDGTDLYLLQCRPQSYAESEAPVPIPRDIPADRLLFSACRYVSNGQVPDIRYIVYVDPDRYAELSDLAGMKDVSRAVSRLNKVLPKRGFILMGPGRWGSRGDIRLGVSVTYSDINNTAVLVEIARQRGKYVPDLSFGTHFFQDLVEADIRYLPLYPDEPGNAFNEQFFQQAENRLAALLPEYAALADVVRVIDVPASTGGRILRILMNGDLDEAVGMLAAPGPAARLMPNGSGSRG